MEPSAEPPLPRSLLRRHPKAALIVGLVLLGVCVLALTLALMLTAGSQVTARREQLARQAVIDPSSAPLKLGHYGDTPRWNEPLPDDYAVQGGMVLFPEDNTATTRARLGLSRYELPVLIEAPDGSDLRARPAPPTGRYVASTEWFLVKCRPVITHPYWWECGLLFGDVIQQ